MIRTSIIRALLWLAHKLGHESDIDYRGRMLNFMRRAATGTREDARGAIEEAIAHLTPVGSLVTFAWAESPSQAMLQVEFTRRSGGTIGRGEQ